MSYACSTLAGYGSIPYGAGSWVGTEYSSSLIPVFYPFDIFCLGPCASLLAATLYPEVLLSAGGQWAYDGATTSIHMWSDASVMYAPNSFEVWTRITDQFTMQWVIRFDALPVDFSGPAYVYLGAGSHQGYVVGLTFSEAGVAYVMDPATLGTETAIPGSAGVVYAGQTYVVKVVVSDSATYTYITEYSSYVATGHQLRFVSASFLASSCISFPYDLAWVRISGSGIGGSERAVGVHVLEYCASSSLLITDFPPIADAGPDQAASFCSIVQLDGYRSADPEGVALQYKWQLLDAPVGSGTMLSTLQGGTFPLPIPLGFTDKWYSTQISSLGVGDVMPGDVLVVAGIPYEIVALGSDLLHGDYIQVTARVIPDTLPTQACKVLRQVSVSNHTDVRASFYPDVAGFYKFALTVFDGNIWSTPSVTVVNVLTSTLPRGVTPDMRFMWEYLSDFWKVVDDKGRYAVVWSGLAQFCASELLNLWQYEYNKSLGDVQRTIQKRWLDFPLRYTPRKAPCVMRALYAPYDSNTLTATPVGVAGTSVTFYLPSAELVVVSFYLPAGAAALTVAEIARQLSVGLPGTFRVTLIPMSSTTYVVRVAASHTFSVIASTCPDFLVAPLRMEPQGSGGSILPGGVGFVTNVSLSGLGVKENDFFSWGGELFRILKLRTTYVPDDTIVLKDPMPTDSAYAWSIPSYFTYSDADFYGQLVSENDDVVVDVRGNAGEGGSMHLTVTGVSSEAPDVVAVSTSLVDAYLYATSAYTLTLLDVYRRTYVPISGLIVDVPLLQETLTSSPEENILRRNLDFFIEEHRSRKCVRFDTSVWVHEIAGELIPDAYPPSTLWSETTYVDNRPAIEANFGLPVKFSLENLSSLNANVDYLSIVRGLWYAYFNGPRLALLRTGAQILLGLPFAEEEGTIEEIRTDYSPNTGRLLVRDTQSLQIVRAYTFPRSLELEVNPLTGAAYKVGDRVTQFAPLVKGVELLDYVSDSTWLSDYAASGSASVLQRFFRFLVRVEQGAFNLSSLMFVKDFILRVKPTYTYPIFSVLFRTNEASVDVTDAVSLRAVFNIYDTPREAHNMAAMWDQPEDGRQSVTKIPPEGPIGSIYKNSYDHTQTGAGVDWAHDRTSPVDDVAATICTTFLIDTFPTEDALFVVGLPVYDAAAPGTPIYWSHAVALPAGTYCRDVVL
jgi:hypothetical protein